MWKSNTRDKGRDCILYDRENGCVVKVFIVSIRSTLTPGENVRMILQQALKRDYVVFEEEIQTQNCVWIILLLNKQAVLRG